MADGAPCVLPSGSPRPGAPSVPPQEEGAAAAIEAPDDLSSPRSVSGSSAGTSRDNSAERDPQVLAKAAPAAGIMKNALVSFKELCGLTPAANIKQCILKLATWLQPSEKDHPPTVTLNLGEEYPSMETQGPVPELLRKVLAAYDTMIQTSRTLIESADAVHAKIIQVQQAGVGFHKELHRLEAKEGMKGRKLQKALESFAWNITVLKGQADLLKHSKAEALDTLWQIHNAAQSCGIGRNGAASPDLFRNRAVLDPIPEAEGACEPGSS